MTQVLLIEDDGRIRRIVEAGLGARGFSVTSAADGASGIEALRARAVDLVLLDLVLPDVDGFALLAAIRAARPRLPVIALTARADAATGAASAQSPRRPRRDEGRPRRLPRRHSFRRRSRGRNRPARLVAAPDAHGRRLAGRRFRRRLGFASAARATADRRGPEGR